MNLFSFALGIVLSAGMAILGYWRGSLAPSGAVGAIVVGTLVFGGGGLAWAILLIAFFVTSSALSHYRARAKEPLAEKFQKGHRRDLGQVFANGGVGALLALVYAFNPHPVLWVAFVGAMATVNADTWATELGVLSQSPPRLITSLRIVPVGTSGGVTWLGTGVALTGAVFIGVVAGLVSYELRMTNVIAIGCSASIAGLLGSLFDSFLGATVQAMYYCDADQKETEARVHRCGNPTRLVRGWPWLDNDGVNLLASGVGALIALGCYRVIT